MDVPQKLATQLGVSLFVGQLLAGVILLLLGLMPVLVLTRDKTAHLLVGMSMLGLAIGLGWLPVWFFAIIILLIAFGFAKMMQKYGG